MADNPINDGTIEDDDELDVGLRIEETANVSEYLRGATWRWTKWTPTPAILYEPTTGPAILYDPQRDDQSPYDPANERPSFFDHDHCHFCYVNSFSTFYEWDANEGWTTTRPPGVPESEQDDYVWWICTSCFDLLRERFEWKTAPPGGSVRGT